MGNLVLSGRGRARALVGIGVALALAGLAGCTARQPGAAEPAPSTAVTAALSPTSSDDLTTAAEPALARIGEYVPDGYAKQSTVSGFDWAKDTGQALHETLNGAQLLQIACSGDGSVTIDFTTPKNLGSRRIPCGKSVSLPFSGAIDAVINGSPANTGVVAWRVLPHQ